MSTRATYRFHGEEWSPDATIYIHHDGYPTGAAVYFYNLLTKRSKGGAATQFIRANDGAELTESHACHGDTEYRYTLKGNGPTAELTAEKILRTWKIDDDEEPKTEVIFTGPVHQFCADNADMLEDFTPFRQVIEPHGRACWLNRTTARAALDAEYGPLHHLRIWESSKSPGVNNRQSGNWQSCRGQALAILAAFPELWTAEAHSLLDDDGKQIQPEPPTAAARPPLFGVSLPQPQKRTTTAPSPF